MFSSTRISFFTKCNLALLDSLSGLKCFTRLGEHADKFKGVGELLPHLFPCKVINFFSLKYDEVKHWKHYSPSGEPWFGFEAVRDLDGLPPEILLIPLPGHTQGHAGVAIETPEGWLLHAGDAYFYREEMGTAKPRCTPGLRAYQWLMEVDRKTRLYNQERLRALSLDHSNEVRLFCSHDAIEFKAIALPNNS